MNNNYHTQIDKQNILMDVASSNNLLQQQVQNYQGTPIKKTTNLNPQLNQQQSIYQQQMNQQQMNQQLNTQVNQQQIIPPLNQQINQQQFNQQQPIYQHQLNQQNAPIYQQSNQNNSYINVPKNEEDEIDLSEPKPEIKSSIMQTNVDKNQQINRQIQQFVQNTKNNKNNKEDITSRNQNTIPRSNHVQPQIRYVTVYKSCSNTMAKYIIIPISLIIVFALLIHPKTSKLFNKYLPNINKISGILLRGVILAIVYIIITLITSKSPKPTETTGSSNYTNVKKN